MSNNYLTEGYTIDVDRHTLTKDGKVTTVRPRTFKLLRLFLSEPREVLSKDYLLEHVWDDVSVDEQVLFQSIRELRQYFENAEVIKTHPRKGYAWVCEVKELTPARTQAFYKQWPPAAWASVAIIFAVILTISTYFHYEEISNAPSLINESGSLLILPIKTPIQSLDHQWVHLGAMDQLIALIKPSGTMPVRDTETVLELMTQAELSRAFTSEDVSRLFSVTGAKLIVESQLLGNIGEYELVYKFHSRDQRMQGVIHEKTIANALFQLAEEISLITGRNTYAPPKNFESDFANELMSRALEQLSSSSYQAAVTLLNSLLISEPNNIIAKRKLAEAFIYQWKYPEAERVLLEALSDAKTENQEELPRIYYWLAQIAFQSANPEQAVSYLVSADQHAQQHEDWLYQAYIDELRGTLFYRQHNYPRALISYQQALTHYGDVHCPNGRSRTLLSISETHFEHGEIDMANQVYQQAITLMNTYHLKAVVAKQLHVKTKLNL